MNNNRIDWQTLVTDYLDYNHRSIGNLAVRMTELSRISGAIWGHFCNLIQDAEIQEQIRNADSFDEIYTILEQLNVPGIGDDTLVSVASKLAFEFDKPLDDSCFRCRYIEQNSKMRFILRIFHSLEEIRRTSPLLENYSDKELFLLLVLSKSRIVKFLKSYENNKNLI